MLELVARWDLDKTYLRSDFYTLRDLLKNLLERPDQKRPVPGAARLLAEISEGNSRVHILSGSPEQLRGAISKRLALDGVQVDQLTLKPNLQNLLRLRLKALRDQLGYKLSALLETKAQELADLKTHAVPEVLFGDDSEADAHIYSLYADICSGHLPLTQLEQILEAGQTFADLRSRTMTAAARVQNEAPTGPICILIHLDRQSPPSRFDPLGPRTTAFYNYAQAAMVMLDRGLIGTETVFAVCQELHEQHRFDLEALQRSYADLRRRARLGPGLVQRLEEDVSLALGDIQQLPTLLKNLPPITPSPVSCPPLQTIDYAAFARRHRGGQDRH